MKWKTHQMGYAMLAPGISIFITRNHIHHPDTWILRCPALGIDKTPYYLDVPVTADAAQAIEEAEKFTKQRTLEILQALLEAN